MKRAIFCIAKSRGQANSIVSQIRAAGFSENEIAVLLPSEAGNRRFAHVQHTKAAEGIGIGATAGIGIGGILGWLVGIGTLAVPGLGPLIAAGPIIAALAGAGAGALAGGAAGSLVGMEVLEFEAIQYQGKMEGGNILVSVLTGSAVERRQVKEIFKNAASVTAAEAIVDHAYGKPAGAVGLAMTPAVSAHANGLDADGVLIIPIEE
jgi:hypothetical protein